MHCSAAQACETATSSVKDKHELREICWKETTLSSSVSLSAWCGETLHVTRCCSFTLLSTRTSLSSEQLQYLHFAAGEWAGKCFAQSNPADSDGGHIRNPNHKHGTVFTQTEKGIAYVFSFCEQMQRSYKRIKVPNTKPLQSVFLLSCTSEIKLSLLANMSFSALLHWQGRDNIFNSNGSQNCSLKYQYILNMWAEWQHNKTNRLNRLRLQVTLFCDPGRDVS